jgi:hypothetical protein
MATSPGHVGRDNEDFVGAAPGAMVLVDGAGIPGTEDLCRHGVAWYSHTLGATLLARMTGARSADPVEALADTIEHVAGLHRHTCDIADPSSPQATVAAVRIGDDRADYLVLADTFVVLDLLDAEPQAFTDARELNIRTECTSPLHGVPTGTAEYERAGSRQSKRCGLAATSPAATGSPRTTPTRPRRL